jgi:DNA-binding beta-propeller fold protein YncE
LATLGGSGTSDEGLFAPIDVDPTNGQAIYVADRESGTIHRFTSEFRAAEVFAVPDFAAAPSNAARARPSAVLAGPGGMLYVAEESRGVVLLLNASRELERVISPSGASSVGKPVGLAFEAATGNLMVADGATGMIRIFDPFGTPLRAVQAMDIGNLIGISQAEERGTLVIGSAGIALMADYGLPIVVYAWTQAEPLVDAELVGGVIWLLTSRRLRRVSLPTD